MSKEDIRYDEETKQNMRYSVEIPFDRFLHAADKNKKGGREFGPPAFFGYIS